jgi:hypothetical protein
MKLLGLYTIDGDIIRERVTNAGVAEVFARGAPELAAERAAESAPAMN